MYIYIYVVYTYIFIYVTLVTFVYNVYRYSVGNQQNASGFSQRPGDFGSLLGTLGPLLVGTSRWLRNYVSENRGFSPQIIHFNRVFHYFHHPFWGTPYFWTHPYDYMHIIHNTIYICNISILYVFYHTYCDLCYIYHIFLELGFWNWPWFEKNHER